jgi:uncharacterized damage-inducible protein DinB
MRIADTLLQELDQEAKTTRRLLERIPDDKLAWKPHAKSMSLGQLAMHVARINGAISGMGVNDTYAMSPDAFHHAQPTSTKEILDAFDAGLKEAKDRIGASDDARMMGMWSLKAGDKTAMTMPRAALYRSILCSHQYHHRGQLSVYLRLLDVDVPSIYGPSADENPFGG